MNLLESAAKISKKLSKFTVQLHFKYCRLLNAFKTFSCRINDPGMFIHAGVNVLEGFSRISELAVTTCRAINYSRVDFFLKRIIETKCVKSILGSKIYFQFTRRIMKLRSFWINSKNLLIQ